MKHHQPNPTLTAQTGNTPSPPMPGRTPLVTAASAAAAVVGVSIAIAIGAPLVVRLMIGSRIEVIDDTGEWLLFTAWDIEHAAQTTPWPIRTLALTCGLAAITYIVSPKRLSIGGRTGGQGSGQ